MSFMVNKLYLNKAVFLQKKKKKAEWTHEKGMDYSTNSVGILAK